MATSINHYQFQQANRNSICPVVKRALTVASIPLESRVDANAFCYSGYSMPASTSKLNTSSGVKSSL